MGWMLALAVFATCMCTDVELMPEKQERERVAAKIVPMNGYDRPTDCRLYGSSRSCGESLLFPYPISDNNQLVTLHTIKDPRQSDQHWNCFKGRKGLFRPTLELFQRTKRAIQTNTGIVSKDENGPSPVRPTLKLFQRTRTGHRQSDQH